MKIEWDFCYPQRELPCPCKSRLRLRSADYCLAISGVTANCGSGNEAKASSTLAGAATGTPDEPERLRWSGLARAMHNISQIIPKTIAASTSVRKCAPNAIRLNRSEEHTSELQSRQYLVCR